jgi:protein-arginine kinase activator protein McsA
MKAKKVKRFLCENCDLVDLDEEPEKLPVWYVDTTDEFIWREELDGDGGLLLIPPKDLPKEIRWKCGSCGEVFHEVPKVDAFQCGECETVYQDRDEAMECCK